MSAFIVEDDLIDLLITVAIGNPGLAGHWEDDLTKPFNASIRHKAAWDEAGQMLVNENYRSVNHRYRNEHGDPHDYTLVAYSGDLSPVQILKACDCYDYQACETDNYHETTAAEFVEQIRKRAYHRLPGYDAAQWGASNPARQKRKTA